MCACIVTVSSDRVAPEPCAMKIFCRRRVMISTILKTYSGYIIIREHIQAGARVGKANLFPTYTARTIASKKSE